ncbi:M23 family metallopeptidase [Burkholderia vietnamiensis]|uniref:M23 family metallopeptidase n=1 Tax=Burkholderia vietnamiensis TaxID=60552 RepID=UPI001CC5B373|nr:M23 family metallopeptidase [Burkholderia vietnamiensis]
MDELDKIADSGGIYPVAFDRRWHTGVHLVPSDDRSLPVRAIADGEVVAYGVYQKPIADVFDDKNTNAGFVLLKHSSETGENRKLTFYSLYMHLLDLDGMTTDGIQPPAVNEPHSMSDWLRHSTGAAVSGGGRKVRRKDILGYTGRCQGKRHLHFEIFMTPGDFDGYFGATQLGHQQVETSQGSDCWGRSYYVIPANQTFRAQPPGVDAHHKLHGIQFAPKQEGQNEHPLYVEVYFNKGDKFTNVWSIAADGSRMLLTPAPVCEAQFEYDLYKRATALYSFCASDGYEMLRFGRILSQPATLPPIPDQATPATLNPRATWYCIPFARGQQGYIDISKSSIKKLSDADFPFFMGWRKIQTQTAPVDQNGLWDLDKLKALVRASIGNVGAAGSGAPVALQTAQQKNESMRHYISDPDHKAVQQLLHGFICEAPSEWDSANLEPRYRNLLDEGEHFEGNQNAYNQFLEFVKKLQFWDKTGLSAGGTVWFFHPLAFIRHFRKCGWLDMRELAQTVPADQHRTITTVSRLFVSELRDRHHRLMRPANLYPALPDTMRKYGINTPLRMAHWFGQTFRETGLFSYMRELGEEPYLTNYYEGRCNTPVHRLISGSMKVLSPLGNFNPGDGVRFSGKGMIQLTGGDNCRAYQKYRGGINFTVDRGPENIINDPHDACDAGGYYWASKQRYRKDTITNRLVPLGSLGVNYWADRVEISSFYNVVQINGAVDDVTRCVNSVLDGRDDRREYFKNAYAYLLDLSVFPHGYKVLPD